MNKKTALFGYTSLLLTIVFFASSCKHEPIVPLNFNPSPDDTTTTTATCDPDTTYFVNEVLPIFASSCAMSGCHNSPNGQDGVVLTSYQTILSTGDVDPGDPNGSKVYDVLFESGSDLMPPLSSGITLTNDQKNAIYEWILQGAQNNACSEGSCDTLNVSYANDVRPIFQLHCMGCHSGNASSGGAIAFDTFAQVATYASNGRLLGAIAHQAGYSAMPQGQAIMSDCKIATIRQWINEGTQNN
ncbi:MAG: hypothetical protein K9J17_11500 [Flavobacteriales bacterium]|nr:hypothetical protein [Flavobacteriales bacterium]